MKLTKVAFAIASVLAVAAGSANAGQIDASSATLATEVIYANNQVVRAPSKSYTFAGAVDARNNEQRLQLQWKLSGTALQWALGQAGGDVNFGANGQSIVNLPAAQTLLRVSGTNASNAALGWNGAAVGGLVPGAARAGCLRVAARQTAPDAAGRAAGAAGGRGASRYAL